MNNISTKGANDCCGCAACESICPQRAIQMIGDNLGFLYPVVNNEICTNCGACLKTCNFKKPNAEGKLESPDVYALRLVNEPKLMESQSGGAFTALAEEILSRGGIVYGASFDSDFLVKHIRVDTIQKLGLLKKSKYTQSSTVGIYSQVKTDLEAGKEVLFSGTPCQTSALRKVIGKAKAERLFLVDILCHGVPSPAVWKDYVAYVKKKYGDITAIKFRDKKYGWNTHFESFSIGAKEYKKFTYRMLFYRHIMLRKSCNSCPFTQIIHESDITIADYWKSKEITELFPDNKGVSLVIVQTNKGKLLIADLNESDVILLKRQKEDYLQRNFYTPTKAAPKTQQFESDYIKHGFEYVAKKYADLGWCFKFKQFIKQIIKK